MFHCMPLSPCILTAFPTFVDCKFFTAVQSICTCYSPVSQKCNYLLLFPLAKELNNNMLNPYRQRVLQGQEGFVLKATEFRIATCQAFQPNDEKGSEFCLSMDACY